MTVTVGSVHIELAPFTSSDGMSQSFASIRDALLAAQSAGEGVAERLASIIETFFPGLLEGRGKCADLIRIEAAGRSAGGAIDVESFNILPSDRYLELVAALAGESEANCVIFRHGWPVLSLVSGEPGVADGEGAGNALPQGPAQ